LKLNQTLGSMDFNPVSNLTPKSLTVMHCPPRQSPRQGRFLCLDPSVLAQLVQTHKGQSLGVGALQHHWGRDAGLQRFNPSVGAQAPTVAGFEAGEAVFGAR
jgi:hypothetical protein